MPNQSEPDPLAFEAAAMSSCILISLIFCLQLISRTDGFFLVNLRVLTMPCILHPLFVASTGAVNILCKNNGFDILKAGLRTDTISYQNGPGEAVTSCCFHI